MKTYQIAGHQVIDADMFVIVRHHDNCFMRINQLTGQIDITINEHGVIPEIQKSIHFFSEMVALIRKKQLNQELTVEDSLFESVHDF